MQPASQPDSLSKRRIDHGTERREDNGVRCDGGVVDDSGAVRLVSASALEMNPCGHGRNLSFRGLQLRSFFPFEIFTTIIFEEPYRRYKIPSKGGAFIFHHSQTLNMSLYAKDLADCRNPRDSSLWTILINVAASARGSKLFTPVFHRLP